MKKTILIISVLFIFTGCLGESGEGPYDVPRDIDVTYSKGNANAKLVVYEYSEYDCPYCAKLQMEVLPLLQDEFISKGDVRLVFKDYPVSNKKYSQKASEACYCAGEQNEEKYWDMHMKLFENHENLTVADLKKYADELQLNINQFSNCLDTGKYRNLVLRNKQEGMQNRINSTPTLKINDQILVGNQPYENIKKVIEAELKK